MQSLRIVLVMIEPPLPFGHATARWFYVLLKGLVERGHRVTAFVSCKEEEISSAQQLFPPPQYNLRCYPFPRCGGLWSKIQTIRQPFSYMFSQEFHRDLESTLAGGYDVLHLEGIWCGWMGQGHDSSRIVLNFHSLLNDIDYALQRPRGMGERLQRLLRRRGEYRLLRSFPTLLTLTPRLKEGVRAIAPGASVHVVPLGMDLDLYPFIPAERRARDPVISLIGTMNWYPTYSAAVRLLTRIWPIIKKRIPEARVQVVGWNARNALRAYLNVPDVEITENVLETRPYFERAGVLLYAPERASGMKVKVLEAFAYGVPVVTTWEGVEGLPAQDGVHADVSDEDEGLAARAVALLGDAARQERQRQAARALLRAHCNPQATLDGIESCYTNMLTRRET